ncbi:Mobile element protein [Richelia intracellularis]|nr:Mobile element protein [Richelia intracellularis]
MISSTRSKNLSRNQQTSLKVKPVSMDCKATVNIGGYSRGGKTRDFIVDTLIQWWKTMTPEQKQDTELIQIKVDNGLESSGVRTQCLKRMVEFVDLLNIPIQLLYYPPYHSKYNPIERCWGILDQHWNGGGGEAC